MGNEDSLRQPARAGRFRSGQAMMTRVFERLFLGDARDAERLAISNPHGIAFVLNVNSGRNREKADGGVEYIPLSFDDAERVPPAKFEQALAAISEHIRRGKVLVHCEIGSSRLPVVALYMDAVRYKNFDDALAELTELRPNRGSLGLDA
jgi:protein-tyrosine phosphatase